MRTSLHNIKEIDDHLQCLLHPQETILFEARLLIDAGLADDVQWHRQTLAMVNRYGRNNLRTVIAGVHRQLFTQTAHSGFRQKILRLFK